MISAADRLYLRAAIELAERGLYTCTPNPRVGCLLVRDGIVLGRGWHMWRGEAHAEAAALDDARSRRPESPRPAEGATAYVSLEPCSIQGETPPCADALIEAGIQRVVAPLADPNPSVNGQGFARLREAGVQVDIEEMSEARDLNPGWIKRMRVGQPWVRLKTAISLDGRTAMASGESRWITGEAARADVQYWRARSCAIVTGAGTVRDDDPKLTVRDARFSAGGRTRQPLRVIVSSRGDIPENAEILTGEGPALIACGRDGPERHPHARVHRQEQERVDLSLLLDHLGASQCNEVMVEAGPVLTGAFLAGGLWDEWVLYVAPKLLGSDARPLAELPLQSMAQAVAGRIARSEMIGEDLRLVVRK